MTTEDKLILTAILWLLAVVALVLRTIAYKVRTHGWIPLSSETAWMLDRGYRCELPPSPWPVLGGAVLATVIVWIL